MTTKKLKIKCPVCVNASGLVMFTPSKWAGGKAQVCTDCDGKGTVSMRTFNALVKKYDDLIDKTPQHV